MSTARTPAVQADTSPIAIIGMACIFPGAPDLQAFWNNILKAVDAIGTPADDWGAQRYLDSGRIKTQCGGFLRDLYRFDPAEFGIMPNSVNGSEPDQFLALRVARDALADAGYLRPDADHTDTGIVLGHSTYLHRGQGTLIQQNIVLDQTVDVLKAAMPHLDAQALAEIRSLLQKKLPPTNADTVPGLVPNVMTGRIANRLNLRGPNYLLDSACSSSLLAVGAAIDELRAGRSRMMLAGGVNATLPAEVTTIFTQLGALTTRGKVRPFSAGSDGTLLGEGLGVVVLKRLSDALADGDRIYSLVRGVGQSSDGKSVGLLAPSPDGEILAIRRTYDVSGIEPSSIGLFEAHGTGIPLGDQTEVHSLKTVFGERTTPIGIIALGSVKSMISHCIPAAGIAGLIKMALSVHHKILPPTLCDEVNPSLGIHTTPFYVNTRTAPWLSRLGTPRRAAVNAFGFGGTNAHAILEEAPAEAEPQGSLTGWPAELCVLSADTAEALADKLERLAAAVAKNTTWKIAEVAAALARADTGAAHRVALIAKDGAGLAKSAAQSAARLRAAQGARWPTRGGVAYAGRRVTGKLAFIFPGEGSQYQGMFTELALRFAEVRGWLDFWHGLYGLSAGNTRTDIAFPSAEVSAERCAELETQLHAMDLGSEAVYIGGLAMHALLTSLGVEPDAMLGHSSGESAALSASGANPAKTPAEQSACITRHYAAYKELLESGKIPSGALLAVGALDATIVEAQIAAIEGVVVAMDNCTNQVVLYGPPAGIAQAQTALSKMGGVCIPLPFDRGYHTPAFADASAAFLKYYREIDLGAPKVPLYSCASVGRFPERPAEVRKLAAGQWSTKVRFRETIQKMHDDGFELFLEVGPSANLTSFVQDILKGREFTALSTNVRRRNDVEQLLGVLGQLYVAGRGPALERLFHGRRIATIDLESSPKPLRGSVIDNTMPMVRLTAADSEAIRQIATRNLPQPAQAVPASSGESLETSAAPGDSGRDRVAIEHLDLMRNFLEGQQSLMENWLGAGDAPPPDAAGVPAPLLSEILAHDENHLLAECHVNLATDNFVRHHVMTGPVSDTDPELQGLSCIPMAVSLEMMAEACAVLAGRTDVTVIENIRAFDWIALDDDELSVEVRAEVIDRGAGCFRASVSTARGVALSAEFLFDAERLLSQLPELKERRESCWNAPDLYTTGMFHGPVFRSLRYIDAWDDSGIDVELSDAALGDFITDGSTPRLILNPVLLDALGQVVACWLVQFFGTEFNNFPSTIDRIELYESCPTGRSGHIMRTRQRPVDGTSTDPGAPRAWQFECIDDQGRVLMRVHDLINVFWQMPSAYHSVRWRPLLGWLGHPLAGHSPNALEWRVPALPADFLAQSGAICLRTLAHALLGRSERLQWRALQGPVRSRIDWLFGRAAVKEAVRFWIHERTGRILYPTDILVGESATGEPQVDGWWRDALIEAPRISLRQEADAFIAGVLPGQEQSAPAGYAHRQTITPEELVQ